MEIRTVEVEEPTTGELVEHIIIDNGDGSFTSMRKDFWDELEAKREQSGTLS